MAASLAEGTACAASGQGSDCGGDMELLKNCVADIRGHASFLKIGTEDLSEAILIASRAAAMNIRLTAETAICARHRAAFGLRWSKVNKMCRYPGHIGKAAAVRPVNFACHEQMQLMRPHVAPLPIGARICMKCVAKHANQYQEYENEYENACAADLFTMSSQSSICSLKGSQSFSQNSFTGRNVDLLEINSAIETLCAAAESSPVVLDGRVSTTWEDLSRSRKAYYSQLCVRLTEVICEVIAPGQGNKIAATLHPTDRQKHDTEETVVSKLIQRYENASSWQEKRQILSLFCNAYTKEDLLNMVPGLTIHLITAARQHAANNGCGAPVVPERIVRNRLSECKIDHFIDFLSDPVFLKTSAYGSKELSLSTGYTFEIPNMIRPVMACHLVENYQLFCQEANFESLPRATLFRVLNICAATYSTSLQGLDNFTSEAMSAFDYLSEMAKKLQLQGCTMAWYKDTVCQLTALKDYLKIRYREHVSQFSTCATHCISYALSDSKDPEYQVQCHHEHIEACSDCNLLDSITSSLQEAIEGVHEQDSKAELQHELSCALRDLKAYRSHILRSVNQDKCRTDLLEQLEQHQALIVSDWAMKFLPLLHREKQQDFFAKRGKSWHVMSVIHRGPEDQLQVRVFVHIFEVVKQDWQAVLAVADSVFQEIRVQLPAVKEIFMRSDNAGCYKNGGLISVLPHTAQKNGLSLMRYDFSEAQDGKGICDRKIAVLRQRIRRYAAEGHDVTTASDMKRAIDDGAGLKGVQAAPAVMTSTDDKIPKWPGIQSLTNFCYASCSNIRVWRSYNIGSGHLVDTSPMWKQIPTGITLHLDEPFSIPQVASGLAIGKKARNNSVSEKSQTPTPPLQLECPEKCLYKADSFQDLENHLLTCGPKLSSHDKVALKWVSKVEEVTTTIRQAREAALVSASSTLQPRGWALREPKKAVMHTEAVKDYLKDVFRQGNVTGHKADPNDVAQDMKTKRNAEGQKTFSPNEWLSATQIASFFSRLASKTQSTLHAEDDAAAAAEQVSRNRIKDIVFQ